MTFILRREFSSTVQFQQFDGATLNIDHELYTVRTCVKQSHTDTFCNINLISLENGRQST